MKLPPCAKSSLLRSRLGAWLWGRLALLLAAGIAGADTVKTIDGHLYRGKARVTEAGITLTDTNGNEVKLTLPNIDSVVFAEAAAVIAGEESLNPPWDNQDVGNVGAAGGARQETNAFVIRASGIGIGQTIDGFHFVYQPMAGDAEIVARLAVLEAPVRSAQGGLMIRQTLGAESAHAAVLLSPGEPASFHYRVSRRKPNPELRGPKSPAPRWLKLEKKGNFYIGSISDDAINWKVVGSQNISLGTTRNRGDQWLIGLAVSSHTNGGLCSALFEEVRVHSCGVKADYFKDEFQTLLRSDILSKPPSAWEGERPAAMRWTGQIIPKYSETYSFTVEPKEASQLWVADHLVFSAPLNLTLPLFLTKEVPVELKLESKLLNARKPVVKLYWSSPRQKREVVPWAALRPFRETEPTNASAIDPHTVDLSRAQAAAAGVVLKSGTLLAGTAKELDGTLLSFHQPGAAEQSLSLLNIARLQFRSMSPQQAARIASAVPGVLLANGDFIEGELRKLSKGKITISSIIFGLRSFDASTEAVAVVLRPFQVAGKFVVRTTTGSAFFAENVELEPGVLSVNEPILGKMKLNAPDLLDLRRAAKNGS